MKSGWIVGSVTVAIAGARIPVFVADFRDIAPVAGLTTQNVYGGVKNKDFILETTGNGVAILDYDGDGRNDILLVNGTRLGAARQSADTPSALFHNEGEGHFRHVSSQSGLAQTGWGQGVC